MVAIQEDFEDPHIVDEDDLGNDDEIIDIYNIHADTFVR